MDPVPPTPRERESRAPISSRTEEQLREAWYKGNNASKWRVEEEVLRRWREAAVAQMVQEAWQRGVDAKTPQAHACAACYRPRQYAPGCAWENCCKRCYATGGEEHEEECDRQWREMSGERGRVAMEVQRRRRERAASAGRPPPKTCDSCGVPGRGYAVVWCCPRSIGTFDSNLHEHDQGCGGYYLCDECLGEE